MKFGALLFTAMVIALALLACAPPASPPPHPPAPSSFQPAGVPAPPMVAAYCDAPSNSDPFLNHVHFLQSTFTPTYPSNLTPPVDPNPITNSSTSGDIQQDLTEAFNDASPDFKMYLCRLDGVYINPCTANNYDPSSCSGKMTDIDIANRSWGIRATSFMQSPKRYIALSLALWSNGHAPPFLEFETRRLNAVLQTLIPNQIKINQPYYSSVDPPAANTAGMSVLAVLAHESGHILWYDAFVIYPNNGEPNPYGSASTNSSTSFCGGSFYSPDDWPSEIDVPPGRWVDFGEVRNVKNGSDLLQLPGLLNYGHDEWPYHLNAIHSKGRWAGALAAFSPDEDFVMTFETFILVNSEGLKSLIITIPRPHNVAPYQPNILAHLSDGSELARKYKCFTTSTQLLRPR